MNPFSETLEIPDGQHERRDRPRNLPTRTTAGHDGISGRYFKKVFSTNSIKSVRGETSSISESTA